MPNLSQDCCTLHHGRDITCVWEVVFTRSAWWSPFPILFCTDISVISRSGKQEVKQAALSYCFSHYLILAQFCVISYKIAHSIGSGTSEPRLALLVVVQWWTLKSLAQCTFYALTLFHCLLHIILYVEEYRCVCQRRALYCSCMRFPCSCLACNQDC